MVFYNGRDTVNNYTGSDIYCCWLLTIQLNLNGKLVASEPLLSLFLCNKVYIKNSNQLSTSNISFLNLFCPPCIISAILKTLTSLFNILFAKLAKDLYKFFAQSLRFTEKSRLIQDMVSNVQNYYFFNSMVKTIVILKQL